MSTSQALSCVFFFHYGSHLLSIGTLMPGIKVNKHFFVSLVVVDCKMQHIKTNQNRIKEKQVHFFLPLNMRSLLLIRSASRPVENKLCEGPIPNRSQLCQIPCPIDCEVSPWGAWGPCTFENCDDQAGKKGKIIV